MASYVKAFDKSPLTLPSPLWGEDKSDGKTISPIETYDDSTTTIFKRAIKFFIIRENSR